MFGRCPGYTNGTLVYDSDIDKNVMVTASHCLDDHNDVYQNDTVSSDHLRNVKRSKLTANDDFDAGMIDDFDFDGDYSFAADSDDTYQGPTIFGTVSKSVMKDQEGDTSWTLDKQGISTKRESGYIDRVYDTDFRTTLDSKRGDSGGPVWREDSSEHAYMAGIHGGSASGYAYHTIMESIENRFNVSV